MSANPFDLPKQWLINSAVRALNEGTSAFLEEIAKELTTPQIDKLVTALQKVRKSRKQTITVKVG